MPPCHYVNMPDIGASLACQVSVHPPFHGSIWYGMPHTIPYYMVQYGMVYLEIGFCSPKIMQNFLYKDLNMKLFYMFSLVKIEKTPKEKKNFEIGCKGFLVYPVSCLEGSYVIVFTKKRFSN